VLGEQHFDRFCQRCHGTPGDGGGAMPDLSYSRSEVFEQFENIVHGAYLPKGMPNFNDRLVAEEINAIKAYILNAASILRDKQTADTLQHVGLH